MPPFLFLKSLFLFKNKQGGIIVSGVTTGATTDGYDFYGDGTVDTFATESVAELQIAGITQGQAVALSTKMDGAALSATINTPIDAKGIASVYI